MYSTLGDGSDVRIHDKLEVHSTAVFALISSPSILCTMAFSYSFSVSLPATWFLSSLPLPVAGLRKISVSYSRISLSDIASKLQLPSASAAEYICAKAIRCKRMHYTHDIPTFYRITSPTAHLPMIVYLSFRESICSFNFHASLQCPYPSSLKLPHPAAHLSFLSSSPLFSHSSLHLIFFRHIIQYPL